MPLFGPPDIRKLKARGDVPGLIKALAYSGKWEVPREAAKTLAELRDPRAVEPLVALLDGPGAEEPFRTKWDLRYAAVSALGQLGDARAVRPIFRLLSNDNPYVREAAADALAELGNPAVPTLVSALDHPHWNVRVLAVETLGRLGWQPGHDRSGARYWIVKEDFSRCVGIGAPAVEPLVAVCARGADADRRAAAEALDQIGAPAIEPLIAALGDDEPAVRLVAVRALGAIGDSRAVEPLVAALGDPATEVRADAAAQLGRLGDPRAVEPVIAALEDGAEDVRNAAAEALGQIGDLRAVEPLIAALGRLWTRSRAAEALGRIGDPRAVEPLIACLPKGPSADDLARTDISQLASVASALGQTGDTRAVRPLLNTLGVGHWVARKAAAEGLVALYRSGKMDSADQALLLAQRGTIIQEHHDHKTDCGAVHTDTGIGATFPT